MLRLGGDIDIDIVCARDKKFQMVGVLLIFGFRFSVFGGIWMGMGLVLVLLRRIIGCDDGGAGLGGECECECEYESGVLLLLLLVDFCMCYFVCRCRFL